MEYYRILGLAPQATPQEIKRAYRRLARRCHPDAAPAEGQAWAEARMARLNEAYAVLSDPVRRAGYDAGHRPIAPAPAQPRPRFSWEPPFAEASPRTRPAAFPMPHHLVGALAMLLGLAAVWTLLQPAAVAGLAPWLAAWPLAGLALVIGGSLALLVAVVALTRLVQPHSDSPAPVFLSVFIVAVVVVVVSALARWAGS